MALRWFTHEVQVLCLGLGSPMESKSAAAQLVFLTSICHALNIAPNRIEFFDPHFTQEDIQGLLVMGFNVLAENKHGKYTVKGRTMLFMPHCGVELYENILRQNWTANDVQRLLLVGNVLQEYETMTPRWKLEHRMPCLSRICKYLSCDLIPPMETLPLAFNNLALQYINPNSIPSHEDALWNLPPPGAEEMHSAEVT
ncbi:hypothetical protein JB92DRAFT_723419 [Gautieria morchelliformis]|nr:hypothetical protein JB92DRAFT_723419 [Gautieria morchelliformis]